MADATRNGQRSPVQETLIAYGRGVAGALLIGLEVLFTLEGWWAGFYMPASRILLLLAFNMGVLLILQYYSGLEADRTASDRVRDAVISFGIGVVVAALSLYGLNLLGPDTAWRTVAGTIAIMAVPLSIGASVAMSQFGDDEEEAEERKESAGYFGYLGMGLAGAMLFGFSVAATQEPMMIGLGTRTGHAMMLILGSLFMVYLIVHAVEFRQRVGGIDRPRWWSLILRHGVSTYVMSFLVAAYLSWTFGYINGDSGLVAALHMTIALTVVTSLGAAAAALLI